MMRRKTAWPTDQDFYLLELRRSGLSMKDCVVRLNAQFGTTRTFASIESQARTQPTLRDMMQMTVRDLLQRRA